LTDASAPDAGGGSGGGDRRFPGWDEEVDGVSALHVWLRAPIRFQYVKDGTEVEIDIPGKARKTWYKAHMGAILEGLNAGEPMPRVADRLAARLPEITIAQARAMTMTFTRALAEADMVEIDLPPIPEVFANRFRRKRLLGRGGVGVVWECTDESASDNRSVVVKHAWNFTSDFHRSERNIRHEAEVFGRLDHPGIPRLVDTFEVDGRFHLAREFARGASLGSFASTGLQDPPRRRAIAAGIANVLHHFHERNLLFLDCAPGNFMVEESNAVSVPDVGTAKAFDGRGMLKLGGPYGTRGYMAPETTFQCLAGVPSDVYGLGRTYAFLVTGIHNASRSEATDALAERIRRKGAEADEVEFVTSCCAIAPENRPATPKDALKLLRG
jgi:hypothetical protein